MTKFVIKNGSGLYLDKDGDWGLINTAVVFDGKDDLPSTLEIDDGDAIREYEICDDGEECDICWCEEESDWRVAVVEIIDD